MIVLTKLPLFMEYLYSHYQRFYSLYNGRLTELFPCSEPTESSLAIAEDDESTEEENEELFTLWKKFEPEDNE
ncbi:MAG TPA: hypothetical protein VGC29_09140 [Flavisolibacter sp.]